MQAPRGDLSSGMLAVSRVLLLKRTCLTGCLRDTPAVTTFPEEEMFRWFWSTPPVVHLPQLRCHPHLPHTHHAFPSSAHDLPAVRLHRGDAQVVGVQGRHGGAGPQVEDSHPEEDSSVSMLVRWWLQKQNLHLLSPVSDSSYI